MPPPARASFPAGLSARVRCRKAVVPELAGRLWRVGGLPRASGRAAARGAATLGCMEGLPIHRCYFGLRPPFTPNPVPDPALIFPQEDLGCFSYSQRAICWGQQGIQGAGPRGEGSASVFGSCLPSKHTAGLASLGPSGTGVRGRSDGGS